MRTLSYVLITLTALAAPLARADRDSSVPPALKLGYVDLQKALGEVGEGREAKARLKAEFDKSKADIEAEKRKLETDKLLLDKQASMMSEEVRTQKMAEWQRRVLDATQRAEKKQQDLGEKEHVELRKIFDKMDPIVAGIAQREGLAMVFEKTDSGLVYAPANMDVTGLLVKEYNEKYPSKLSAAPASPKDGGK